MIASKSARTIELLTETRDGLQRLALACGDRETRDLIVSCAERVDRMVVRESEALANVLAAARQ